MFEEKTWDEFRKTGLLWWINMVLHTFGWAICLEYDEETEEFIQAYPVRTNIRGFSEDMNTEGYIKVSEYMAETAETLHEESKEE